VDWLQIAVAAGEKYAANVARKAAVLRWLYLYLSCNDADPTTQTGTWG